MRAPLFSPASTTSNPKEAPLMIRFRLGKVCFVGVVAIGNSLITAPDPAAIFSARGMFSSG